MWLVPRGTVKINQSAKPLPEAVRAALDDWYSGRGSLRDEEAAVALAQQARKNRYWLACSCRGDGTTLRAPMLTFNFLSEAETYYLRRLTGASTAAMPKRAPIIASKHPQGSAKSKATAKRSLLQTVILRSFTRTLCN